jgi:hypothetical protein
MNKLAVAIIVLSAFLGAATIGYFSAKQHEKFDHACRTARGVPAYEIRTCWRQPIAIDLFDEY